MITEKESRAIKKLFGVNFAAKIAQRLKENGETNRNGDPFKSHSVSDVLMQKPHSVLEPAIRKVWEDELDYLEKRKERLLNRSKSLML